MATASNRLKNIILTDFDASTLNAAYQVINGSGTEDPCIAFKFFNSSASLILLSYDGVNNHDFVPPGGTFIFDAEANADGWGDGNGGHKELPQGTRVFAKTTSATDRLIFVGYK